MFHSLAPTGLSPPTRKKIYRIDNNFNNTFLDFIKEFHTRILNNDPDFDMHANLLEMVKFIKRLLMDGLLKKYPSFWSFVINFLSSFERKHIAARCGHQNPCIFWIKKSIEEKMLVFQLHSFTSSPPYLLNTYYEKIAWIRNPPSEVLDALDAALNLDITYSFTEQIQRPMFRETIPVAEVRSTTNAFAATQYHKNGNILSASQIAYDVPINIDASECIAGDILTSQSLFEMTRDLPAVEINDMATNINNYDAYQDILTEDDKRTNGSNDENLGDTLSLPDTNKVEVEQNGSINMDSVVEDHSQHDEEEEKEGSPIEVEGSVDQNTEASEDYLDLIDGEFILDQFDVVQLGLKVFKESGERYLRSFKVYTNHASGSPRICILLLTDKYCYLLSGLKNDQENYPVILHVKLNMIEYISVGVDYQCINFHCNGPKFRTDHGYMVKTFSIETASFELGKKIIWMTKKACKVGNMESPVVLSRGTEGAIALNKFLMEHSIETSTISFHGLTFWKELESSKACEMEGYIQLRMVKPGFFKSNSDWVAIYASLKGGMLCQYTDSSCKEAIAVTHLRDKISNVYETEVENDERYIISVPFVDQEIEMQVACPTMEAMKDWKQAFNLSIDMNVKSLAVPCTLTVYGSSFILAQEGYNFAIDKFMRQLKSVPFRDVKYVLIVVRNGAHVVLLVHYDLTSEWLYMRNLSEMKRFEEAIGKAELKMVRLECDFDYPFLRPYLQNLQSLFSQ